MRPSPLKYSPEKTKSVHRKVDTFFMPWIAGSHEILYPVHNWQVGIRRQPHYAYQYRRHELRGGEYVWEGLTELYWDVHSEVHLCSSDCVPYTLIAQATILFLCEVIWKEKVQYQRECSKRVFRIAWDIIQVLWYRNIFLISPMERIQKICKIIIDNPEIELKALKKKFKHKPRDLDDLKSHLLRNNFYLQRTYYTRLKEDWKHTETYKITLSIKKCKITREPVPTDTPKKNLIERNESESENPTRIE